MAMFYQPNLDVADAFLTEDESRHCVRTLRLRVGDLVEVTDGRGTLCRARIRVADPKKTLLDVLEVQTGYGQRAFSVHIALAPTKNTDRTEWFVEKSVELGIERISLIHCEHSERKIYKTDRLHRIAVEAMKQSQKARLPLIVELAPFKEFVQLCSDDQKWIAHLEEGERQHLWLSARKGGSGCVLIGPEGDFSPTEISLALGCGFAPVSLGPSRLRTETAALAACHMLNLINF